MPYKSSNKYKVYFKDGTSFESSGSADSEYKDLSVREEFKWVSYHIGKEISSIGKQQKDIARIEYTLLSE